MCKNWLSNLPDLRVIISQAISFRRPFELIIGLADDFFPGEFTDRSIAQMYQPRLSLAVNRKGIWLKISSWLLSMNCLLGVTDRPCGPCQYFSSYSGARSILN